MTVNGTRQPAAATVGHPAEVGAPSVRRTAGGGGSLILLATVALLLWAATPMPVRSGRPYLHAPSVDTYARHDPAGLTILPTGRHLKPVGKHFPLAKWPHGLAMSPDGTTLFIASDGVGQFVFD